VVVLRTFSKAYGMAGLRCGFAIGRADLLEKIRDHSGWNFMPVSALVAASASLKDPSLVPARRRINASVRQETFEWLDRNGYSYIPSVSNCFLLDAKRPAKQVIDAMAQQNVFIGRIWPIMPTCTRITLGTHEEMERFRAALQKVMSGATAFSLPTARPVRKAGRQAALLS
jgi:histidinol-phosphate aminotransferase